MRSVNRRLGFGRTGPMILCFVLTLLMPMKASALEWLDGKVQVHGFAGQGATYTDHNQVFGTSRDVSLDFREMGLNTSVKLLPNLLISAQGLYRDAGASDRQGVRLDFAQADYSVPLLDSSLVLGIRGGRVKIPFGLYNDTRDVLWTRPSVLLPQSIYFDTLALRQAMIAADGGILYGRYTHGEHRFGWEFLTAEPQDSTGGATDFLTGLPNLPGLPKAEGSLGGRPMLIGRAFYEWMGGRGKLMFSIVDLDRDFQASPALSAFYQNGNIKVSYPLFSAQYNAEKWSLTAEYGWISSDRTGFTTANTAFIQGLPTWKNNTSENFYVQGEYRFTPDFSAVLRYDVFHLSRDDRDGRELSRLSGGVAPSHRFYARDLTAGVRWSFARNFLLAADYHYVNGTAWLNETDNPNLTSPETSSHFSLVTAMLSFRF
jgi:hypothetical protein